MRAAALITFATAAAAEGVLEETKHAAAAAICDPVKQYTGYCKGEARRDSLLRFCHARSAVAGSADCGGFQTSSTPANPPPRRTTCEPHP